MKKYLFFVLLSSLVLMGCVKKHSVVDVNTIHDITALQDAITQVSQDMSDGTISMEQAQNMLEQLQQKYVDLTDIAQKNIETQLEAMEKTFETKSIASYNLPLRAKKLGMTEPKGMELNKVLSRQTYVNEEGYSSTILVYKGNYTVAMQQAAAIAKKARLAISKEFEKAQALAKVGDVNYISGLDVGALAKGIIYTNHDLFDTNIDNLLSVSVDQDGTLVLEATKYK